MDLSNITVLINTKTVSTAAHLKENNRNRMEQKIAFPTTQSQIRLYTVSQRMHQLCIGIGRAFLFFFL